MPGESLLGGAQTSGESTQTPTHTCTDRCRQAQGDAASRSYQQACLQTKWNENRLRCSSSLPGLPIISSHDASSPLRVQFKEKVTAH